MPTSTQKGRGSPVAKLLRYYSPMTPRVNLHMHSRHSDGTLWPDAVAERGHRVGLTHMALTDHDTMDGVDEFLAACAGFGIRGVAGVEIDCEAPEIDFDLEIIGLFPQGARQETEAFCRERQAARTGYAQLLLEVAAEITGTRVELGEVLNTKAGERAPWNRESGISITRVDIFNTLLDRGLVDASGDYPAFKRGPICRTAGRLEKPHVRQVVQTIQRDGGVAVLPHPGHLWDDDAAQVEGRIAEVEDRLATLRDWGVQAVEIYYYGKNRERLNELFLTVAKRLGLELSWGSDCHGPGTRADSMEKFWGREIPPWLDGNAS